MCELAHVKILLAGDCAAPASSAAKLTACSQLTLNNTLKGPAGLLVCATLRVAEPEVGGTACASVTGCRKFAILAGW